MGVVEQMDTLFFDVNVNLDYCNILEIGSRIINYDLKAKLSERFENFTFKGIDCITGRGVDVIADICNYKVEYENYDAIFAITVFEHVVDWRTAFNNMKAMLKHGGSAFVIVPSIWPIHMFPIDQWRYSEENLCRIFSDFAIEKVTKVVQTPGLEECIFIRATKEHGMDLTEIELERPK
jgi:cyclopropane fatty-acyl-phospholipid synthase-like methyltransferase